MSDSDSEIDMNTPPDIVNAATNATNNLLPQKSRAKYAECAQEFRLYEGRCYKQCPNGTYSQMVDIENASRNQNVTSSDRKNNTFHVIKRDTNETNGSNLESSDMISAEKNTFHIVCSPCHYTCATCSGPYNSQCLSCFDDAQIVNLTDFEPKYYCFQNTVLSHINDPNWYYSMKFVLSIVLYIVSFIILYMLITCLFKKYGVYCCRSYYNSNISNIAYNKLASDEKHQSAIEIEKEIQKALRDTSESESEDDLNL